MSWLKEVQVNKTECKIYLMDLEYHVFAELPCSTEFYPGVNDAGLPRDNPADGVYKDSVWFDIDYPNDSDLGPAYGWAYLNIDDRGRALHGGGSILGWDEALEPFQERLTPTEGCIRMYNADIFWLCQHWKRSVKAGITPVVHVVS
jgi:hypothetical protein